MNARSGALSADAGKEIKGRKRHLITDALGLVRTPTPIAAPAA
ncbi:hypothetical protein [Streptomyces sp. NPDC001108]